MVARFSVSARVGDTNCSLGGPVSGDRPTGIETVDISTPAGSGAYGARSSGFMREVASASKSRS